ncbi:MAG TPA: TonB-dependent receptor [Steroidobacteraceae bacterium]|nr:TonB-dependent receptor [Steroidobacteraceae bacterium]
MFTRAHIALLTLLSSMSLPAPAADPDDDSELDTIVVNATRSPGMIRDQPLRVEAVPAGEIEENSTIQPGAVTALLKELPGIRVQTSAAGLSGAGMRLRGFPERDTLVLADGLPLLGVEPDAFSLLQTPPLDLARAEVIKGSVSALYGNSGLGGVLNLISQTPDAEPALIANATSRGGQDIVAFLTGRGDGRWGGTLTAGAHHQSPQDVDDDGWLDIASFHRVTLRPRLWWHGSGSRSLFLTAGVTDEHREGGTSPGRTLPGGASFDEALETRRYDIGALLQSPINDQASLSVRVSLTSDQQDRTFGGSPTPSTRRTALAEATANGDHAGHRWVIGLAASRDDLDAHSVPGVSYRHAGAAAFAQDEFRANAWMTLAASARLDALGSVGSFFSPRLSALLRRPGSEWSLRASIAGGFAAPTPFVDDVEETGLGVVAPLAGLRPERARTAAIDAKWSDEGWDVNASVFYSEVRDPLATRAITGDRIEVINAAGPWRAPGAEVLVGYTRGSLHVISAWSLIDATESAGDGARTRPDRIPHETISLDGIYEVESRGRFGIEIDYTGQQALHDNPYRSVSPGYFEINVLGEMRFGKVALFVNALNVANRRQTDFDPLIRPLPGPGGNPITAAWAPLAGRTFNLGIRVEL